MTLGTFVDGLRGLLTRRLRAYLDYQFDRVVDAARASSPRAVEREQALSRIDVDAQNREFGPDFERVRCQVVSAAQFEDPHFDRLRRLLYPAHADLPLGALQVPITRPHRKLWEFCFILRAVEQHGLLRSGRRAIGFGVGREPLPAAFAAYGMDVVATDRQPDASVEWSESGQHMSDLDALDHPHIVPRDVLTRRVRLEFVDMNHVPSDLGRAGGFDVVWSACALEHLGSPAAGTAFVSNTLEMLAPGGISVHTTELELTRRSTTADYGNLAIYRVEDLDALVADARARGYEAETNWYVSMDTPADRWVSLPPHDDDIAHLKLSVGTSITTSVGLLFRAPDGRERTSHRGS